MPLTDRAIANLKATGKIHKHFDGGGLYVHVSPSGGKLRRLAYRFGGKEKLLSFGSYPAITLKRAREKREEAKTLLAEGIDPGEHKKEATKIAEELTQNTFENIAREWHAKFSERWEPKNAKKILVRMEKDIFPFIGSMSITTIKPKELLTVIRRIEARGAVEYAHRTMQYCGKVFRYAIATDRAEHDISADLRGAIPPPKTKHHATITDPIKVGQLLRAIDSYDGYYIVASALKMAPLTFVRPGELRGAEWAEFDFDQGNGGYRMIDAAVIQERPMEHKYEYTTIDLNAWNREKRFALYKDCGFPFVGVTTNIDVSGLVDVCRREKRRFFSAFVHLLISTISRFDNFRLRMVDDKVVLFDAVDPSFTVLDTATDLFYIAVAETSDDISRCERAIEQAEKRALENKCLIEKRLDLVYMTCIPWLGYSELVQPIFTNASDSIPRLAWGKFKKVGESTEMPLTVAGHHGFIDGIHIARFIEDVCQKIEKFTVSHS